MPERLFIDLRSDTVTRPSARMRAAMAAAEVGDDVYGEDPTVNRLEAEAAALVGKEAALFVPTGTMGNTIAIKAGSRHGDELVCDARAHIVDWELSMCAWFAGVLPRTVASARGILSWRDIEGALRTPGPHNAGTALIALENTHNMGGGAVYPLPVLDEICHEAHRRNLRIHMDGARMMNAAVAQGLPAARLVRDVDTVMFCLSKGLGAPAGSMLAGSREMIAESRLLRKRLGGGMRQAGVLAAAGLIALEDAPAHLVVDHSNASLLAKEVSRLDGVALDPSTVETNIVIFSVDQPRQISAGLREAGVLANAINQNELRMVTHRDVSRDECLTAADALKEVLARRTVAVP